MTTKIVHHHDVTWNQGFDQHLGDPGAEGLAVDRSIEDAGRCQTAGAKGGEKGQRAPLAMRRTTQHARAFQSPSAKRGHVRLHPGFINEDKPVRIEPGLYPFPEPALTRHVRAQLLQREETFF